MPEINGIKEITFLRRFEALCQECGVETYAFVVYAKSGQTMVRVNEGEFPERLHFDLELMQKTLVDKAMKQMGGENAQ